MTPYATVLELETYLHGDAPSDAERLLDRASELIRSIALGVTDPEDAATIELLRDATCAQVEQWIISGEDQAISGRYKNTEVSIGSLTVKSNVNMVAPRAITILASGNLTRPIGW